MLTISVPTKVFEGAPLAILSGEWVILVMKISYFPGKKIKKLLRNHQQLNGSSCTILLLVNLFIVSVGVDGSHLSVSSAAL